MTSTVLMETNLENTDNKIASLEKLTEWLKLRSEVSDEEAFIYSQAVDNLEEKVFSIEKILRKHLPAFQADLVSSPPPPPTPPDSLTKKIPPQS